MQQAHIVSSCEAFSSLLFLCLIHFLFLLFLSRVQRRLAPALIAAFSMWLIQMNRCISNNRQRQIKQWGDSGTLGQSSAINIISAWASRGGAQVATAAAAVPAGMRRPMGSPTPLAVTVDQSPWADQRHLTPATRGADCFHALTDTTRLGWRHPN